MEHVIVTVACAMHGDASYQLYYAGRSEYRIHHVDTRHVVFECVAENLTDAIDQAECDGFQFE